MVDSYPASAVLAESRIFLSQKDENAALLWASQAKVAATLLPQSPETLTARAAESVSANSVNGGAASSLPTAVAGGVLGMFEEW